MHKLRNRLKSDRGASLIIALLFFMICVMVSSVILTASVANMGRVEKRREEEQAYLAVSSAARLLQDDFANMTAFTGIKIDMEYTCPYAAHANSSGEWACKDKAGNFSGSTGAALSGAVNDAIEHLLNYNSVPPTQTLTITPDLPALAAIPVQVDMTVNMDYTISLALRADAAKDAPYRLTMNIAGTVTQSSSPNTTQFCTHTETGTELVLVDGVWVYPTIDHDYAIIETTYTTTVVWARGTISKGK